jgi:hypothetical protein
VLRRSLISALSITALGVVAALCLTAPASAAGHARTPRPAAHTSTPGHDPGLRVHLTGPALTAAANQCAAWATDAGFPNNGYMSGGLTIAVAVALAESGCNPAACYDNTISASCTQKTENSKDSLDRGAWQLNNAAAGAAPDSCAYSGPCSATAAYYPVSQDGTYFARWVRYSTDTYAGSLWAAQQAVNALRRGTVASTVTGSCLGFPADRRGARVKLANCGSKTGQIWRLAGSTLRTPANLCAAATSRSRTAPIELAKCTGSSLQAWAARPGAQLYNTGAHRCLDDPVLIAKGGDKPGVVLVAASCNGSQGEGWFKP